MWPSRVRLSTSSRSKSAAPWKIWSTPGLAGDDREQRDLHAVDQAGGHQRPVHRQAAVRAHGTSDSSLSRVTTSTASPLATVASGQSRGPSSVVDYRGTTITMERTPSASQKRPLLGLEGRGRSRGRAGSDRDHPSGRSLSDCLPGSEPLRSVAAEAVPFLTGRCTCLTPAAQALAGGSARHSEVDTKWEGAPPPPSGQQRGLTKPARSDRHPRGRASVVLSACSARP